MERLLKCENFVSSFLIIGKKKRKKISILRIRIEKIISLDFLQKFLRARRMQILSFEFRESFSHHDFQPFPT